MFSAAREACTILTLSEWLQVIRHVVLRECYRSAVTMTGKADKDRADRHIYQPLNPVQSFQCPKARSPAPYYGAV